MFVAYAQLAAAMALVGANVAVAKLLAEQLPIALVAMLRCLIAVAVLWPLARWRDGPVRPSGEVLRNLALQAVFGTAIYNAGLLAGLAMATKWPGGTVLIAAAGAILGHHRGQPRSALAKAAIVLVGATLLGLFVGSPYVFLDWQTVLGAIGAWTVCGWAAAGVKRLYRMRFANCPERERGDA